MKTFSESSGNKIMRLAKKGKQLSFPGQVELEISISLLGKSKRKVACFYLTDYCVSGFYLTKKELEEILAKM